MLHIFFLFLLEVISATEFVEIDRNDTIMLIFKESFFENIHQNFIGPFNKVIEQTDFKNLTDLEIPLPGDFGMLHLNLSSI